MDGRGEMNVLSSMLAMVIGAVIGVGVTVLMFALLPHRFFSTNIPATYRNIPRSSSNIQINSSLCESMETINLMKKQVKDLNEKLELATRMKHSKAPKYGPFGTVIAPKTNPIVAPDVTVNPRLTSILSKIAINNELLVAIANSHVKPMLEIWFTSIKRVAISNYLVVALDDTIIEFCKSNDVPVYRRDPNEAFDSIGRKNVSRVVSSLKFLILREFLQLGYNVLLSDTDVVFLQNPFDGHLYRDSDIESMSDGYDTRSAYGFNDVYDDPVMGWSRFVYTTRLWSYNSGFFYIRATVPSIKLLDRVASTIGRTGGWDQAVFNVELFCPSNPGYVGLHAAKRTMDLYLFMNSKVRFKYVRKDGELRRLRPVVVHVNYHPDKIARMKGVCEFYIDGKDDALDSFTDETFV